MKSVTKLLIYAVIFILMIFAGILAYISQLMPNVGKPERITIDVTPQRVARGQYLANHVCLCMDCHSERDWAKPVGAIDPQHFGSGGYSVDSSDGYPGEVYMPNITPYRLANWTDGQILRALTTGVRKDGTAIYPLMPWYKFAKMSREDLYSIIAYLRTLPPVKTPPFPPGKLKFPMDIWVNTLPYKANLPADHPQVMDTVKYGAYLVDAASCSVCHATQKKGVDIRGMEYAGGRAYPIGPGKTFYAANITPDRTTGIGNWTEAAFVGRFKSFTDSARKVDKSTAEVNPMPWYDYSGMSTGDLKSIYVYLRSIKPVKYKTP
jgi:mono/diheme cytochrome c family protein